MLSLGAHLKETEAGKALLRKGTIRHVIDVKKNNGTAAFNVLDLSLGQSHYVGVPPSFDDMASEEYATSKLPRGVWQGREDEDAHRPLRDQLIWGTISNKNASSWPHVDDEGFATVTCTLTGGKLWGLMTRLDGSNVEDITAFHQWDPTEFKDENVRFELLYLPPKCALCVLSLLISSLCSNYTQVHASRHFSLRREHGPYSCRG